MPGRDGTGPGGIGSRTGRGLGRCTGVNAPGYGRGAGYGMGPGMGFRGGCGFRGYRWWSANQPTGAYVETQQDLKNQAEYLENELKAVQARMAQLNNEGSK